MITITYQAKGKKHKLSIEGHAEHGEQGKDLVCCAVSTLFYTLAQSLLSSYEEGMLVKAPSIHDDNGNGTIKCVAYPKYEANISLIWWTITNGFMLLEQNYPENIKIIKKFS
jgi:uncharacterized protein YsxB (DUF464 family)